MPKYTEYAALATLDSADLILVIDVSNTAMSAEGTTMYAPVSAIVVAQSQVTGLTAALAAKAPIASPALTGTPSAPTAAVNTNTTQLATTAFVVAEIADAGGGGGGIAVGDPVTGGTNGRILYQDASGNLAQDADLTFDGSNLVVGGAYPTICMLTVRSTFSTGMGASGIKVSNIETGKDVVLNVLSGGDLFLSDAAGVGVALGLASRTNPSDGSINKAQNGWWTIENGGGAGACRFCVNRSATDDVQFDLQIFSATTKGVVTKSVSGQTANQREWQAFDGTIQSTVSENGYYTTRKNTAPADAELVAGECAEWFDSTNGAAKRKFKAKTANGTVVVGEVALT